MLTIAVIFFGVTIASGVYKGLQHRFGSNVFEGWRGYQRQLHEYGTNARELRRALRDPIIAAEVDRKYRVWVHRQGGSIAGHSYPASE